MCRHAFILATFQLHELPNNAIKFFFHENPFFVYLQVEDDKENIHPRLTLSPSNTLVVHEATILFLISGLEKTPVAALPQGMGQSGQYA